MVEKRTTHAPHRRQCKVWVKSQYTRIGSENYRWVPRSQNLRRSTANLMHLRSVVLRIHAVQISMTRHLGQAAHANVWYLGHAPVKPITDSPFTIKGTCINTLPIRSSSGVVLSTCVCRTTTFMERPGGFHPTPAGAHFSIHPDVRPGCLALDHERAAESTNTSPPSLLVSLVRAR